MPRKESSTKVDRESAGVGNALISPKVDVICGGGLSLAVAIVVMIYGAMSTDSMNAMLIGVNAYLFTDLLINGPHFMASYRVLYARRENLRQHPVVTIVAPILAVGLLVYVAVWSASAYPNGGGEIADGTTTPATKPTLLILLNWLAPILLGWHYVGQSWGATACFAYLSGFKMSVIHRRLIRCGFHALFVYHLAWAGEEMGLLEYFFPYQQSGTYMMQSVMQFTRVGVLICFCLGLWGFWMLSSEQNRRIPPVVWLPWVATFSWYVMVDVYPKAFPLLQVFHALQYLLFPARVEINTHANPKRLRLHMLVYYLALVLVGWVAFEWTQILQWFSEPRVSMPILFLGTATMMIINIHHYFIDAVIWKIRDPEVRRSVFGHVEKG